jgi:ATPase subunit of ABC transporter with duplicated ATPase domains
MNEDLMYAMHVAEECKKRAERAEAKVNELEHRIRRALNELGIPQPEYPAPVANAVSVLRGEESR